MKIRDIVRAWRNPEYREARSAAEQAALPESPAGPLALDDAELDAVLGAAGNGQKNTMPVYCPPGGKRAITSQIFCD
jgi:mersacidin/lichenicidin family type 2 lantibiotic